MAIVISQIVRDYLQSENNIESLTLAEIAHNLMKKDERIRSLYSSNVDSLRKLISRVRKNEQRKISIPATAKDEEIKTRYHVSTDKYIFEPRKGTFLLPIEVVDELFYSYSEHGLNWSSQQIIQHFKLEPWQWHAIKSALYLYKKSPIFAPHTISLTDPDTMRQMISDKLAQHVNTIPQQIEREYHANLLKEYKKTIKRQASQDFFYTTIADELVDLLPTIQIERKEYNVGKAKKRIINVIWADLHFGAKNPDNPHLPTYGAIVLQKAFEEQVLPVINQYQADEVNLFLAGDLIESATGLNHPNSWQGMEPGLFGAELIYECVEFLLNACTNITNLKRVYGVAGNHDRSTPDNRHDTKGVFATLIFGFLKRPLEQAGVQVTYDPRVLSTLEDGINYIMSHGHEKLTNKPEQLVLKYGVRNTFTVCISGHWHTRKILDDSDLLRNVVVASIFPGNDYSIGIGFRTLGGFTVIENGGFNLPLIHDHPITYECYKK